MSLRSADGEMCMSRFRVLGVALWTLCHLVSSHAAATPGFSAAPGCLGAAEPGAAFLRDDCTWAAGDRAAASSASAVSITGVRGPFVDDNSQPATVVIYAPEAQAADPPAGAGERG